VNAGLFVEPNHGSKSVSVSFGDVSHGARGDSCTPRTSCHSWECGYVDNGCGALLECGACPVCGNGTCESGETPSTCPVDCSLCGNGVCEPNESPITCAADCGGTCLPQPQYADIKICSPL